MTLADRLMILSGYLVGFPALYVVLAYPRGASPVVFQARQAFVLWCIFGVIWLGARFLKLALVAHALFWIFWGLLVIAGILAFRDPQFRVPWVNRLSA